MPYRGTDIKYILERRGVEVEGLTQFSALCIQHITIALRFAHEAKIVHRDVRPENVSVSAVVNWF